MFLGLMIMIACPILVYRYAEMENLSGVLWAGLSILLWLGARWLLPVNFLGILALQGAMLVGMRFLAIRRNNC